MADQLIGIGVRMTQVPSRTTAACCANAAICRCLCATPGLQSGRNAPAPERPYTLEYCMSAELLNHYAAIEKASQDMLEAARIGNWDEVVKLEGVCVVLISQLKHAAGQPPLARDAAQFKSRIMQRILINDAEIRTLAEPWLQQLDQMLNGRPNTLQ